MVHFVYNLPVFFGALLFAITAVVTGLGTYAVVRTTVGRQTTIDTTNLATQLFRVVATLLSLLLSLTFADVRTENGKIRDSIKTETALLADIFRDLSTFESVAAEAVKTQLVEYIDAVIEEEWPALKRGEISENVVLKFQELEIAILNLEPETRIQTELDRRLIQDIDAVSESRTRRLVEIGSGSPAFLYLALLGFLWSTALLGACSTRGKAVFFIGTYCAFVGIVIYFILALDQPFDGIGEVTPDAFNFLSDYAKRL